MEAANRAPRAAVRAKRDRRLGRPNRATGDHRHHADRRPQAGGDRGPTRCLAGDPARHGAGHGGDPLRALRRARSRLRPRDRLHGRRRGHRPGGAGFLRRGHAQGAGGPRADPLSLAPPPHHALRDVRDQAAHQGADLRRAAVAPSSHRQRQRVFGALLAAGPRVLRAGRGPPAIDPRGADRAPAGQQQRHGRPVRQYRGSG